MYQIKQSLKQLLEESCKLGLIDHYSVERRTLTLGTPGWEVRLDPIQAKWFLRGMLQANGLQQKYEGPEGREPAHDVER